MPHITRTSDHAYRVDDHQIDNPRPAHWRCDCGASPVDGATDCEHISLLLTYLVGADLAVGETVLTPSDMVLHVDGSKPMGHPQRMRWVPEAIAEPETPPFGKLGRL